MPCNINEFGSIFNIICVFNEDDINIYRNIDMSLFMLNILMSMVMICKFIKKLNKTILYDQNLD